MSSFDETEEQQALRKAVAAMAANYGEKYYLEKSGGRLAEALARYNGSYGQNWYPERVMLAWERRWR